jgi:hypothetical protein
LFQGTGGPAFRVLCGGRGWDNVVFKFTLADDFFHTTTHVRLNFAKDFFVGATFREAVVSYSGSPPADSQLSNAYRCSFVRPKWTEATPARDAAILAHLEQQGSAGIAVRRREREEAGKSKAVNAE